MTDFANMTDDQLREHYAAPAAEPSPGARSEVVQGRPMSTVGILPQPTEEDQQAAARGARETAGQMPRQRIESKREYAWMSTPPAKAAPGNPAEMEDDQLRAHYLGQPKDDGVALMERLRLNRQDAYYRSSLAGSMRLALLAETYRTPDPPGTDPERKAVNKQMREEYVKVVADLAAHDQMEGWGTTMEAMAAFGGQLEGTLISPESWIGWGAKGVSWIARSVRAGLQQAGIQAATDPIVQALDISAGVEHEYNPLRTVASAAFGFGIGAGGHAIGEAAGVGINKLVGQHGLRKILWDLAAEDPSFDAPRQAAWALDPNNGIRPPETPRAPLTPEPTEGIPSFTNKDTSLTRDQARFLVIDNTRMAEQMERAAANPDPRWPPDQAQHYADQAKALRESVAYYKAELAKETAQRPRAPEFGFDDAVAAERERVAEAGGKPEEADVAAFEQEVGPRLAEVMEQSGIPPEKAAEVRKFYQRAENESVQDAAYRAVDDWVAAEEKAGQGVIEADPILRQELEAAEPRASRDEPPADWEPTPEEMAEAKRLSRGWTARARSGKAPTSLVSFVRGYGGLLKDGPWADDLLSQDIGRQPGLLRSKEAGGRSPDDMAVAAKESGFDIGPDLDTGNGINMERFLEMLVEDAGGRRKHYPAGQDTEAFFAERGYNDEVHRFLRDQLGVNPKGMDPRKIAWLLSQEAASERTRGQISSEGSGLPAGGEPKPGEAGATAGTGEGQRGGGEPAGGRAEVGAGAGDERAAGGAAGAEGAAVARVEARKLAAADVDAAAAKEAAEGEKGDQTRADQAADLRGRIAALDEALYEKFVTKGGDYVGYRLATDATSSRPDPRMEALREELRLVVARVEPQTERTAQGEQTLMPGVAPVTDRQRIESQMAKPMAGGDKAPPAGGLFDTDARAQTDIFAAPSNRNMDIAQRRKGDKMAGEPERIPAERVEPASPEQDVAIRSLQQQSMDLAKALDFPLRQGRVTSRKAAGTFFPSTGVVRVREVPDFDVVSHEAGHAIESKVGADLTALTDLHAAELRPLDYDQTVNGRRVNEGFAEFVRLMMTNPAYGQRRAPTFAMEFRSFMTAREPEMLAKIDAAAAAYKAYLDAPSVDAVGSVRRSVDDDPKGFAKVTEAIREDGLPVVIKSVIQKTYDVIWDDKAPVARVVRKLGVAIRDRTGAPVDLKAADNPEVLQRMVSRSRQAAVRDLMDGVRPHQSITPEGPSFADGLSEMIGAPSVWGKWDAAKKADASTYVIARRAELLWRKYEAGEIPNPPVAFSKGDAEMAMRDLEAVYPTFRSGSDMIHAYNQQLLRKAYEGGLIDADLFGRLSKEEFYVPFMRDMSDKPGAGSGTGQGSEGPGTTQIVKRLRGSSRDIKDPFESIMAQTFMVNRTLRHNDVIKAFVGLAQRAGPEGGKYVEVIPPREARKYIADLEQAIESRAKEIGMDPDEAQNIIAALGGGPDGDTPLQGSYFKMEQASARGEPIVFYREGGELKAARFMSEKEGHGLYEILTAAPEPVTDLWVQMIGVAASVKRAGIVTNPTFAITNYFRDQVAASILRSDYIPIVSGMKGIADEFRQGQSAVLYGYAGGVAGGASTGPVDRAFKTEVDSLAKKGYLVNRVTSFKGLLELASFTEAGTRNSIFDTVFEASKRRGLSDYEAMVEAAFQAQDLLDFSRHGSRTIAIRNLLPFVNAHLQGLDKARRTMIEPITNRIREGKVFERDSADFNNALAAWTKAGAIGGALGAVWAAVNADSEAYRDASPYFKGTHLVVPWGNKIVVMPKPFELGIGFTAGEYAFHALAQKDPRAARQFIEAAWQSLAPPNPITDIPILSTATELTLGRSLFTGRDIVPEQLARLPAEQQFSDRTSELAKWLGKHTGLSPIKIEYGIGAEFGSWGRDVMAMGQGVSENSPAASLDDAIFFRRFVKDPTRSSAVTTKFWDYMSRTTGKFNQDVAGYNDMVKDAVTRGASPDVAKEFLSKLPAAERAYVTLKSAGTEDGKEAFKADERRLHPLQRAYDAVSLLNTLRREISTNAQMTYGGREKVTLDPNQRRLLLENVRELAQLEMRNALVIMGEGGFSGRPMLDPNDAMDKIRAISPAIGDEIASRYATAKIYTTQAVQKSWPTLRDELVRNGTDADIKGLGFDAKAEGYQFQGQRTKRPGIIRRTIQGTP